MVRHYVLAAALAASCLPALAQPAGQRIDFGKREFDTNCASCHGPGAKGDGPLASFLKRPPADLTVLARKNGGVFPIERVYNVIDGTTSGVHGTREMPVWGHDYRVKAAEYYVDVPYDPETFVRGRILSLVDYLNRIQAK